MEAVMLDNYERDQWLKENAPDPGNYNSDAVKALMKIAYDAGRKQSKSSARQSAEDERERNHGPAFI
jgi:hypothetical protein